MERSPEASPPRARRSTLDLTLPTAPRLSQMSGSSVVYLDESWDFTVGPNRSGRCRADSQSVGDSAEIGLSSSAASDLAAVQPSPFLVASPTPAVRRSFGVESAAASLLATQELSEIHSLIKLKSERVAEQERALQRGSCAVAEIIGAAQVQLRSEVEALLQASQRELKKQVAAQRRRLDEVFLKAKEEFRKVVAWRREMRSMKDSLAAQAEEKSRLAERLNDAQRRCSALAEREKAHRQTLLEERAKWEKERSRLEEHHQKLRREMEDLREQRLQQEQMHQQDQRQQQLYQLNVVARRLSSGAEARRIDTVSEESPKKAPPQASNVDLSPNRPLALQQRLDSANESDAIAPYPDYTIPMLGAWWSLDMMSQKSNYHSLWGYVLFLTEVMDSRTSNSLWDLADCFVRKWSWQLLVEVTRKGWLTAVEDDPSAALPELEHNALAWARARRQGTSVGVSKICAEHRSLIRPYELSEWPPDTEVDTDGKAGPLQVLHVILKRVLHADVADDSAERSHRNHVFLTPVAAQRQVAALLWRSVRQQLLFTEDTMRNGTALPGELAEVGRTLLAAAALSLPVHTGETEAALRSLSRLCDIDEHRAVLQNDLSDALPLLLWIADAAGAMCCGRDTSRVHYETCELIAALLPMLFKLPGVGAEEEISMLVSALLRCSPKAPIAEPLAQLFSRSVAAPYGHRRMLASFGPRLHQWLQKCYADAPAETADRLAAHLAVALHC